MTPEGDRRGSYLVYNVGGRYLNPHLMSGSGTGTEETDTTVLQEIYYEADRKECPYPEAGKTPSRRGNLV